MVTVITPTYKRHQFLKNAIESVLAQTYADFEMIIVDDNPPRTAERIFTEDVIREIDDPRIRYIQNKENMGGAASRNVAIEMANGEYIAFLDDDDVYLPTKIEKQYNLIKKLPEEYGMVYCWMSYKDFETNKILQLEY